MLCNVMESFCAFECVFFFVDFLNENVMFCVYIVCFFLTTNFVQAVFLQHNTDGQTHIYTHCPLLGNTCRCH